MFSFLLLSSCAALSVAQYAQYGRFQQAPPQPMPFPAPRPLPVPLQPFPHPAPLPQPFQPQIIPHPMPQPMPVPVPQPTPMPMPLPQQPFFVPQPLPVQPEPHFPELDCEKEGNGYYVKGCSSDYWRCVDGLKYGMHCATGLKFDPKSRACEYQEEVSLCNVAMDSVNKIVKAEEIIETPEEEILKPVPVPQPAPIPMPRPQQPVFVPQPLPVQTEPLLNELDCQKEGNGFYVKGCSSHYWRCVDGRKYKVQCVADLKFNPETRECQYEEQVPLCNVGMDSASQTIVKAEEEEWTPEPEVAQPLPSAIPDCQTSGNGYYVKGCSSQYWRCAEGRLFELECASGLKFSPETRDCEYKEEVSLCKIAMDSASQKIVKVEEEEIEEVPQTIEKPLPPKTLPMPEELPKTLPADVDCEASGNGFYVKGCSMKYWRCVDGRLYERECSTGLMFNPETRQCTYKADVPLCSAGMDQSSIVKAEEDESYLPFSCDKKEDGEYTKSACSDTFISCYQGIASVEQRCPWNMFFNPKIRACDFKQNVEACEGPAHLSSPRY